MKTQNDAKKGQDERASVKSNMEKATEKEPSEFRDEANEEKRVEIGKDLTKHPIRGIDPKT
ncbi:hypothetical protein QTH90_26915 [Variovorax sp. J2P1-59]|uniref:hypothetical protein n=1 Tax=Variovorax flavidus TaxID=3053501 RepID=UPI00257844C8|nr:hypothetical protein [Variovorax sp. J2P1-59]MDM0078068.1 hypothetical protein [Variovorax sp. J2P1-59]